MSICWPHVISLFVYSEGLALLLSSSLPPSFFLIYNGSTSLAYLQSSVFPRGQSGERPFVEPVLFVPPTFLCCARISMTFRVFCSCLCILITPAFFLPRVGHRAGVKLPRSGNLVILLSLPPFFLYVRPYRSVFVLFLLHLYIRERRRNPSRFVRCSFSSLSSDSSIRFSNPHIVSIVLAFRNE